VEFYDRATPIVARELLGAWILARDGRRLRAGRIVETEAYVADDAANHAHRGPTLRNRTMFGPPGSLYVYRIHQVHCANAVTRAGEAVLLRAADPLNSGLPSLSGPGRLCRGLGVTQADDGASLVDGRVRIAQGDSAPKAIVTSPRVGVSRSVDLPLRFLWDGHAAVSRPRPWGRRAV
jgi:DNA-3-methyladenine glycosylase